MKTKYCNCFTTDKKISLSSLFNMIFCNKSLKNKNKKKLLTIRIVSDLWHKEELLKKVTG